MEVLFTDPGVYSQVDREPYRSRWASAVGGRRTFHAGGFTDTRYTYDSRHDYLPLFYLYAANGRPGEAGGLC